MKAVRMPAAVAVVLAVIGQASAEPLPTQILTCSAAKIARITARLEDGNGKPVPNSGLQVFLDNKGVQVSYDMVPAIKQSRVGDHVFVCLVFIPHHCPPGDDRGRMYTTTNLRTLEAWTLPDSEHQCGGA